MTAQPDEITILRAEEGAMLAKRIGADGTAQAFDNAKYFTPVPVTVAGVEALHGVLAQLANLPRAAVVRGALIAPPDGRTWIRRLTQPAVGWPASLRPCPRPWVALDLDGWTLPDGVAMGDVEACGRAAIASLPVEFHGAAAVVQATAGHGIKPGMRLRLWFWLSRLTGDAELKAWLSGVAVDHALFAPSQLHYTASPIFDAGRKDHLASRLALLEGAEVVAVPPPAELAPAARPAAPGGSFGLVSGAYVRAALENGFARILAAPEGGRHSAIASEAAGLARFVVTGQVAEDHYRALLTRAAAEVGKTDAGEIEKVIGWALALARARSAANLEHAE